MILSRILPAFILINLVFVDSNGQSKQQQQQVRGLAEVDLSSINYDEIHRLAVQNQIDNYSSAQKSLQTRPTKSLNGLWDFCLDKDNLGFSQKWFSSSLKEKCEQDNYYRMPVPSAFNDITSISTVRNYIGWFWYQTKIDSLSLMQQANSEWYIQFENVNYLALVWIQRLPSKSYNNNEEALFLGSHVGGHLPFIFTINATTNISQFDSEHMLTVAVSNRLTRDTIPSGSMIDLSEQVGRPYEKFQPDFDFFHYSGIMGNVNLIRLNKCHFTRISQFTGTPRWRYVMSSLLSFEVCFSKECLVPTNNDDDNSNNNNRPPEEKQRLHGNLFLLNAFLQLPDGKLIDDGYNIVGSRTSSQCQFLLFPEEDFNNVLANSLWSTSDGKANKFSKLIEAKFMLTLASNSQTIDLFKIKFGYLPPDSEEMSQFKFVSQKQFQGFGMHHEQLFSGRYMTQAAIMKDIYLLKQMGANLLRTSHYPYSNEFLDACDENGIWVIAETPAVGLNSFSDIKLSLHKQILLEMMERDTHHRSIIMWSIANEPQSQLLESREYFKSLLEFVRKNLNIYSAGRPLTAAIAQSHKDDKIAQFLDVIMINRYYGWYDYTSVIETIRRSLISSLAGWSKKHPGKPLIISEFGADTISGLHSSTRQIFSEEYQRDLLVEYERIFDEVYANKEKSGINFTGSMIWNFADFSTHDSLLRVGGNRKGLFDRERQPKLAVENIREIYLNRLQQQKQQYHTI